VAIRTQLTDNVRRVITKVVDEERRVSCSCCVAAECCMYPADQLGVGYTEDDLPNDLFLYVEAGGIVKFEGTLVRSGAEFVNGTTRMFVEAGLFWRVESDGIPYFGRVCLFSSQDFPYQEPAPGGGQVTVAIQDNFEDAYSYNFVFNGNTIESGTITRTGLCTWSSGGGLFTGVAYSDGNNVFGDQGAVFEWATYDGNDFQAIKTPPHNSPEGTYVAASGLYAGAVATVVFP
jgi:hypothetical protein